MYSKTFRNSFNPIYDKINHSRAPYSIDGGKSWKNCGQYIELEVRYNITGEIVKPDHIPFDEGNDLEILKASIKSNRATLTTKKIGTCKAEIIENYFKMTKAELHIWAILEEDSITTYYLNDEEFRFLLENFSSLNKGDCTLKLRETKTMIKWLEDSIL